MIHAALVNAYPTEADARRALMTMPDDTPYLGVWIAPSYERPEVHVFSVQVDRDDLLSKGWVPA